MMGVVIVFTFFASVSFKYHNVSPLLEIDLKIQNIEKIKGKGNLIPSVITMVVEMFNFHDVFHLVVANHKSVLTVVVVGSCDSVKVETYS